MKMKPEKIFPDNPLSYLGWLGILGILGFLLCYFLLFFLQGNESR